MKKSRLQPSKPLERHTPMPRGTTPLKRTELRRSSQPPVPGSGLPPSGSSLQRSSPIRSRGSVGDASPDGPTTQPNGPVKKRSESSTIPSAIRAAVLERDGYSCQRCGRYLVDTIRYGLQHRRPRGAGGSRLLHTMANLVTLCGWVGDAGTCTDHVEEQDRAGARRDGWLVPHGVTPEQWPVLRWTAAGPEWQQPGEQWTPATPHPRQIELGGGYMSQQDMDRLRDVIATELGLARDGIGYEEAGVADEAQRDIARAIETAAAVHPEADR